MLLGDIKPFVIEKSTKKQVLKVVEEACEVHSAWERYDRYGGAKSDIIDEIADCIQACVNLAASYGVDDLAPYMVRCDERNRERGRYEYHDPRMTDIAQ